MSEVNTPLFEFYLDAYWHCIRNNVDPKATRKVAFGGVGDRAVKIAFNTGAHYTTHGQRIGAWLEEDEDRKTYLCFVDFDRMIDGYFPFCLGGQFERSGSRDMARHVMHMYDWGQYRLGHSFKLSDKVGDVRRNGYDCFIADKDCVVIGGDVR